jgi:hypothetical protein
MFSFCCCAENEEVVMVDLHGEQETQPGYEENPETGYSQASRAQAGGDGPGKFLRNIGEVPAKDPGTAPYRPQVVSVMGARPLSAIQAQQRQNQALLERVGQGVTSGQRRNFDAYSAAMAAVPPSGPSQVKGSGFAPVPFEFRVNVRRLPGSMLGLELDLLDEAQAQVVDVKPGLVNDYNQTAPRDEQVRSRDWIVEANGRRGSLTEIHRRLKRDEHLDLVIRRCAAFPVQIRQEGPGNDLGLELKRAAAGLSLQIVDTRNVFRDWNATNPLRAVKNFDRIVEVNGVTNDTARMMDQMNSALDLRLMIVSR